MKASGKTSTLLLFSYTRTGKVTRNARELWRRRGREALGELLGTDDLPPVVESGMEAALASMDRECWRSADYIHSARYS